MVIKCRRHAAVARHGVLKAFCDEFDERPDVVSRFVSGVTYKHLDSIAPPVQIQSRPVLLPEEVRPAAAAHRRGASLRRLARELGISRDALARMIRHLEGAA